MTTLSSVCVVINSMGDLFNKGFSHLQVSLNKKNFFEHCLEIVLSLQKLYEIFTDVCLANIRKLSSSQLINKLCSFKIPF